MVTRLKFILLTAILFTSFADAAPVITLSADKFSPGEPIIIKVKNLPGNPQDWLTLVKADAAPSNYGEWAYSNGVKEGSWTFTAPKTPGNYEVRVFFDFSSGDYTIHARAPLEIANAVSGSSSKPRISVASQSVEPREVLEIEVKDLPGNPQDWIAIVAEDATPGTWGDWIYTEGKTEGKWTFKAPAKPGRYEIRVHFGKPIGNDAVQAQETLIVTAEEAQAEKVPSSCTPQELGTAYDTTQGRLQCQISEVGMDCRAADTELDACGRVMNLTFEGVSAYDDEGHTLVGDVFENGTVSSARMLLNSECNIYSGSWRKSNGHFVHLEATPVADSKPLAVVATSDNSCTVANLGKHYWSSSGEYECRVVGNRLNCCTILSRQRNGDCSRLQGLNLELSSNRQEVVGQRISGEKYESVSIGVDERCNLTGGVVGSCRAQRQELELRMLFDPIRAQLDQSKPEVQHEIGLFYLHIPRPKDALPHFSTAAEAGHIDAQFQLAVLLESQAGGLDWPSYPGIEQDVDRATELYATAAAQGHKKAQASLERRREQQAHFDSILEQATQGDADAQNRVSLFYRHGKLVTQNGEQQFFWAKKAAQQEHPAALYYLGRWYYYSRGEENRAFGLSYLQRSAELGYPLAYLEMASIALANSNWREAYYGDVDSALTEYRKWLKLAIDSGDAGVVKLATWRLKHIKIMLAEHAHSEWLKSSAGIAAQQKAQKYRDSVTRQLESNSANAQMAFDTVLGY